VPQGGDTDVFGTVGMGDEDSKGSEEAGVSSSSVDGDGDDDQPSIDTAVEGVASDAAIERPSSLARLGQDILESLVPEAGRHAEPASARDSAAAGSRRSARVAQKRARASVSRQGSAGPATASVQAADPHGARVFYTLNGRFIGYAFVSIDVS